MNETTATGITQVATVGIPVGDQDRALAFYVTTLGFEKRLDAPFGAGLRWVEVAPPGATTTIALLPPPPGAAAATGTDTGIRLTTTDADADHRLLGAAGVDTDPEVMRWPGVPAMFSFRDPDGNTLYLVEGS
jgi:catechol 2,3-dioxygenase-like lactoylglutathione lyase family enzyme